MENQDLGILTEEELLAWDSYAAATLAGVSARVSASPNNAAKKAAETADALVLQRRLRDPDA
ncbi:hypothetical protein A2T76_17895 [Pseudomonas brenneri]|nr:hypothetical protein [Pseudomonas carnis]MDW8843947.1 hypothetical protein [Pseudomonas carnis]OAE15536.1 hypothetical protein A2T76_17895 [Pseudomonas brenneri]